MIESKNEGVFTSQRYATDYEKVAGSKVAGSMNSLSTVYCLPSTIFLGG